MHFDSGTVTTIYLKPDEEPFHPNWPAILRHKRVEALSKPLTTCDLILLEIEAAKKLRPFLVYQILLYYI